MKEPPIKKLYYSISEVSKMTSLKPYILRYWESEFSELRPSKNRAGKRIYRSNEVELIRLIKSLLYEQKYTIEGAKQKLREIHKDKQKTNPVSENPNSNILEEIKRELLDIIKMLER